MRILNNLIANGEFSEYLNENYDDSSEFLKYYLDINEIYDYINSNTHLFIVENDLESTYVNIKNFSKTYTESLIIKGLEKAAMFSANLTNKMITGHGIAGNTLGFGGVIGINTAIPMTTGGIATAIGGERIGGIVASGTEVGLNSIEAAGALLTAGGGSLAAGAATAVGAAGAGAIAGVVIAGGFLGFGAGTFLNKLEPVSNAASWVMDHGGGKAIEKSINGITNFPKLAMSMFGNAPVKVVESAKINNVPGVVSPATVAVNHNNLANDKLYESGIFEKFINYVSSKFHSMGSEIGSVWDNLLNIAQNQPHYLYGPILVLGIIGIIIKYKLKRQKTIIGNSKK